MEITTAEEFVSFLEDDDIEVQQSARLCTATLDVWRDIILGYPDFKFWVILNKTVPLEILDELSRDPDVGVRMNIARKGKLPREIFERLAVDENADVRRTLAYNRKLPIHLLDKLTNDPDEKVQKSALDLVAGARLRFGRAAQAARFEDGWTKLQAEKAKARELSE